MLFLFTVTETEQVSMTPTIRAFLDRVNKFNEEYPEASKDLYGELLLWASVVASPGETAAKVIESQIEYSVGQIRKSGGQITVEEYLDGLFSLNSAGEISADIIMGRFQLG
jgi:hypothetical protein